MMPCSLGEESVVKVLQEYQRTHLLLESQSDSEDHGKAEGCGQRGLANPGPRSPTTTTQSRDWPGYVSLLSAEFLSEDDGLKPTGAQAPP
uniref:Uncharacterized protein n=1 Tax=Anguilla anguilla TaxID=7936 RepID=A0A0E9SD10_ANGAN